MTTPFNPREVALAAIARGDLVRPSTTLTTGQIIKRMQYAMTPKKPKARVTFWPWFLYAVAISIIQLVLITNAFSP